MDTGYIGYSVKWPKNHGDFERTFFSAAHILQLAARYLNPNICV